MPTLAAKPTLKTSDVARLCQAVRSSRKVLERFRKERLEAVREYVGAHWSDDGAYKRVPVNLLAQYVEIVGKKLVSKSPRFMLSTPSREHKPAVSAMESWANRAAEEMGLAETMQRTVLDALFSIGIVKVGLASPADASAAGWNLRAGAPFAERVDLDDFAFDTSARDFKSAAFIGHRYRVPVESVKSWKRLKGRSRIEPTTSHRDYNEDGDERISHLQFGDEGSTEEFEDMVDLWEIYLPRRRLIVTLLSDDGGSPLEDDGPLQTQEWLGPDHGPYLFLKFGTVPGAAMPKAPVQDLIDMHLAVNQLWRKLIEQAARQKEILPYSAGMADDTQRLTDTSDGETFRCDSPELLKPLSFGGPNAGNFQFVEAARMVFSWKAGNLDAIGGLSPQAKTATQDQMLQAASSATVSDMQDTTVRFVSEVGKALVWYWWHDPFKVMRTTYKLPSLPDVEVERKLYPQGARGPTGTPRTLRRDAKWSQLEVRVDPYSLTMQTPAQRASQLTQVMTQVVMPMAPLLAQQGTNVDLAEFLTKLAKYMDLPDLNDILSLQEPPDPDGASPGPSKDKGDGMMPGSTTRNYVRESTSGRTQQGTNNALAQLLQGTSADGTTMGQQPMGASPNAAR